MSDDLRVGPVSVDLPSAGSPGFCWMEDLTSLLGVATNAEALERIEAALRELGRPRGIDLDAESDSVLVDAATPAALRATLVALERAAGRPLFADGEVDAAIEACRRHRRPRRLPVTPGDVAAVPLRAGFGAVHVLDVVGREPLVGLLDVRRDDVDGLRAAVADGLGRVVTAMNLVDDVLCSGKWPVVARRTVDAAVADVARRRCRGTSCGPGLAAVTLDAWFGLAPWDGLFDPGDIDRTLLPGVSPPPTRRLLRDVVAARVAAARAAVVRDVAVGRDVVAGRPAQEPAPSAGPGVVHVLVVVPEDVPRLIDLPKSRKLVAAVTARLPGARVRAGGGGGALDVLVATDDVAVALPAVDAAIAEVGLARDVLVDVLPAVSLED